MLMTKERLPAKKKKKKKPSRCCETPGPSANAKIMVGCVIAPTRVRASGPSPSPAKSRRPDSSEAAALAVTEAVGSRPVKLGECPSVGDGPGVAVVQSLHEYNQAA